ncbi:MAG: AbrB/MazE/SpoVT family DNA-binding domain-containing protein [Cellvibrionaceae bacterium]|nr:AbrB/MazE/SpoVT family DNA-binding domain-containing protein [Cellvibrionaceae bacterium]
MPKVSAKRQITLPIAGCEELGIQPGDEVEILRHGNQFNIIKKQVGSAAGLLKGTKVNKAVSDEQSRQDQFE